MLQNKLFHERLEDALGAVIDACGGRKQFAVKLFPDKIVRDAHNLVDAMLNPERKEKFSPTQVAYIARRGREVGCHAVMEYLSREAGYAEPVPLDPEDAHAALQRKFIEAVGTLEEIQQEMLRVQRPGSPTLRSAA